MHSFLRTLPIHISRDKAKDAIAEALGILGVKRPQLQEWATGEMVWKTTDGKRQTFPYRELLTEAQKDGFSRRLYELIDRQDHFFGGTLLMATNSPAFKIKVTYGGYEQVLRGPCRFSPLENDLTEDILHFRASACSASASNDYYDCTRHYRSFLQSSISLIDCFINRYAQIHAVRGGAQLPEALTKPATFESRFDAWLQAFAIRGAAKIKQSAEWSQCSKLRQERNRAVHAVAPYIGIQIQDLPQHFNHVRRGIGGLLFRMREAASQTSLGFIERLRNAPMIEFQA